MRTYNESVSEARMYIMHVVHTHRKHTSETMLHSCGAEEGVTKSNGKTSYCCERSKYIANKYSNPRHL